MKVTTVRFGGDLWRLLDREASRAGVSVSQYIREAALARAAASAAAHGEDPVELLGQAQQAPSTRRPLETARDKAAEHRNAARALRAQSEQAARQAQALTDRTEQAIAQARARDGASEDR